MNNQGVLFLRVLCALRLLGVKVSAWPRWLRWTGLQRSLCMTLGRRIFLRDEFVDAYGDPKPCAAAVLAHELEHARRARKSGVWWYVRYIANPWFRLEEERMGEGMEAAARYFLTGELVVSHRLSRGWPYFVPGSKASHDEEIREWAMAFIASESKDLFFGLPDPGGLL